MLPVTLWAVLWAALNHYRPKQTMSDLHSLSILDFARMNLNLWNSSAHLSFSKNINEVRRNFSSFCMSHLDPTSIQSSLAPPSLNPASYWHDCRLNHAKCNQPQIQFFKGNFLQVGFDQAWSYCNLIKKSINKKEDAKMINVICSSGNLFQYRRKVGQHTKKTKIDRLLMCRWIFTSLTHMVLEGKEYSKGDTRYATRESGIIGIEGLTSVLEGRACILAAKNLLLGI
uniref:Uncharacterized protein n=1 Tax=Cucumis melo TaxID=3656 RepID=A0A9I9EA33_CUCME